MNGDAVRGRLARVLLGCLRRAPAEFREDTGLYGRGLGLSSLDVVSLIVKVEEEFDIFFEAGELAGSVATFGALARAVQRKLVEREAGAGGP